MCAGWECKSGMSDCGGATAHCILDRKICDGVVDCPGGEDEEGLLTSDGLDIQCGLVVGPCRLYETKGQNCSAWKRFGTNSAASAALEIKMILGLRKVSF